jgi:hypothetical protein
LCFKLRISTIPGSLGPDHAFGFAHRPRASTVSVLFRTWCVHVLVFGLTLDHSVARLHLASPS